MRRQPSLVCTLRAMLYVSAIHAALYAPLPAGAQTSSTWYGQATIANDLRRYGVSQQNSDVSLQAGFDYQHLSGLFVGVTAANVDYATDSAYLATPRSKLLGGYLGYRWNGADWLVNAGLSRYHYPDVSIDYDYSEWSAGVVYRNHYFAGIRYIDEILALWGAALDYEFGIAVPTVHDIEVSGAVGRFQSRDFFGIEYTHWNIGVSKTIRRFSVDMRYHATSNDDIEPLGNADGDHWVISLSYGLQRTLRR